MQKSYKNKKRVENRVYKQILYPEKVRKEALTLAIGVIRTLEKYENYKKLKMKKQFFLSELKRLVSEIKEDMSKVNNHFPTIKKSKYTKQIPGIRSKYLKLKEKEELIEKQGEKENISTLSQLHSEAEKIRLKLETFEI